MAKFKALVCGDSFALLDPRHSSWMRLWAENRGGTTEHRGYSGNSHVRIVHQLINDKTIDWASISVVFYCITDFMRLEGADAAALKRPEHQHKPYNDHHAIDMLLRLNNQFDERHTDDWRNIMTNPLPEYNWMQTPMTYPVQPAIYDEPHANTLYNHISIRWVCMSNYLAFKTFSYFLRDQGIPLVGIQHAWSHATDIILEDLPHIDTIWRITTEDGQIHGTIDYPAAASQNHVETAMAVLISQRFDSQVYATGLFTLKNVQL